MEQPNADAHTETKGSPGFAGSFGIFGMGESTMRQKHGNEPVRPAHEGRFDVELDVTTALSAGINKREARTVRLVPDP